MLWLFLLISLWQLVKGEQGEGNEILFPRMYFFLSCEELVSFHHVTRLGLERKLTCINALSILIKVKGCLTLKEDRR